MTPSQTNESQEVDVTVFEVLLLIVKFNIATESHPLILVNEHNCEEASLKNVPPTINAVSLKAL